MDLQKQLSKLEQDSFNGQISISDFRKRVQTYAETYHALQLHKTHVSGSYNEDSDLDKLKKVFEEIGVEFKHKKSIDEFGTKNHTIEYCGNATYDEFLNLDNGVGYYSFECDFYFLDGKYQNHGVWE